MTDKQEEKDHQNDQNENQDNKEVTEDQYDIVLEDYDLNATEDVDKSDPNSPAQVAQNQAPDQQDGVQRIDDYTPGGETQGKVEMQDISLTMRSRSESNTKSKTGQANASKNEPKKSLMDTSQSFSVRFSNIFGAPKDIYIPGLDDDPKPQQTQGGQGQQQQAMTYRTGAQNSRRSSMLNSSYSNENQHYTQRTKQDLKNHNKSAQAKGNRLDLMSYDKNSETLETGEQESEFQQNQATGPLDADFPMTQGDGPIKNTSVAQTYFNMFKCFIGIGILATPSAIAQVGIFGGAMGIILCGCLNMYTMRLQIACKLKLGEHISSYSELGFAIFGQNGKAFIDFCILVSQFGFCVAYLIFIGKQLDQVICIETQQDYCNYKNMYIMLSTFILVPIQWLKTFKFISYISIFANCSIIFALIVIMVYSRDEYVSEPELHENIRYLQISHLPLFFGVAVFNFEGNGVILNIHSSMKDSSQFESIMRNTLIAIISILVIFSVCSYEAFGDRIDDMVTMNLPHDNLTSSVQLLYCLGLLGSFPLQAIPAIDISEKTKCFSESPNPFKNTPYIKNIILRTIIVIGVGISATIIPKFGLFINLTGAFACTALAFILPVMMYSELFKDELSNRQKYFHYCIVIFGTICGSISFFITFVEIIKAFGGDDEEAGANSTQQIAT